MHRIKTFVVLLILFLSIIFSQLSFAQWRRVESPQDRIFSITQHSSKLFAASEDTGVWASDNGGQTWYRVNSSLYEMTFDVSGFAEGRNRLWAGFRGGGVCLSTDGGRTWQRFNEGFQTQAFVGGVVQIGDTLFAAVENAFGLQPSGVYRTSVHKAEWVRFGTGMPTTVPEFSGLHKTASNVLIAPSSNNGVRRGNIYVSEDFGRTWQDRRIADAFQVFSVHIVGNSVFAGTSNGIYFSNDNCKTWRNIGLQGKLVDRVIALAEGANASIYAAVDGEGIFFGDNGEWGIWYSLTKNLPIEDDFVSAIYVFNNHLFASLSAGRGLWSMPLTTVSVGREAEISGLNISSPFPQPTRQETNISITTDRTVEASVTLHDALGNVVLVIKDRERFPAGKHTVTANVQTLPSGVYYCRVSVGGKSQTQAVVRVP
ncbi:MAG: T9SS type A sorting domain-containing protein [Candidatus Kapabacteria bacterium]|jgi:photosystem II stability/assembly factor-like uncharacterized protein|nr:T9SS type A sorting domain-containing protein [Candidatus Kapabacteria bacterium]